jgi:hypothetical protein
MGRSITSRNRPARPNAGRRPGPNGGTSRDGTGNGYGHQVAHGLPDGAVRLTGQPRAPLFEVVIDDGVDPLKASGIVELHGWSGSTTAPLLSLIRAEQVADLTIGVTLNRIGDRVHESVREGGVTERVSVVSYLATITVDTSDGRSGTAECFAEEITVKIIRPDGGQ